ncbi:MAG: hypothetical protein ACI9C1_003432 [Candidatus Aldehydirespiratoraceae bacterium]
MREVSATLIADVAAALFDVAEEVIKPAQPDVVLLEGDEPVTAVDLAAEDVLARRLGLRRRCAEVEAMGGRAVCLDGALYRSARDLIAVLVIAAATPLWN